MNRNNMVLNSLRKIAIKIYRFDPVIRIPKYVIPLTILSLYFLIRSEFISHSIFRYGQMMRMGLLGVFLLLVLQRVRSLSKLYIIPTYIFFSFLSDVLYGNVILRLSPVPFLSYFLYIFTKTTIGPIILLQLYITSLARLKEVTNAMIAFFTITLSLIGFFQMLTGTPLADYSSISGGDYFFETSRLFGLTLGPGSTAIGLIICLSFLIANFMSGNRQRKILFLIIFNSLALILTFSRSGYIAVFAAFFLAALLVPRIGGGRKKSNRSFLIFIFFMLLIMFFFIGIYFLGSSGESLRFLSPTNILLRLKWWGLTFSFIDKYLFFGIGLKTDLSFEFWRQTIYYVTPHNFILAWVIRIGLLPTIFMLLWLLVQFVRLIRVLKTMTEIRVAWVGYGILLAYTGVFVASQAGSDYSFMVLLMASLTESYFQVCRKPSQRSLFSKDRRSNGGMRQAKFGKMG